MFNRKFQITMWLIYSTVLLMLICSAMMVASEEQVVPSVESSNHKKIESLNYKTTAILNQLVKTKYFRILRLNINSKCPLPYMNKLCRSKSCAVCRCD